MAFSGPSGESAKGRRWGLYLDNGDSVDSDRLCAEFVSIDIKTKSREGMSSREKERVYTSRMQMRRGFCIGGNLKGAPALQNDQATKAGRVMKYSQPDGVTVGRIYRDRDLLEKTRRQDEEMRSLQDRVVDLEMSTRVALDHLESVPEKLSLLEDVKDLGDSHRQREIIEERYSKYKEIVGSLQQQLEDSKRRIQEYRAEKKSADLQSSRLSALSSSLRGQHSFLSSSLLSDSGLSQFSSAFPSPMSQKRVMPVDFEDSLNLTINGSKS